MPPWGKPCPARPRSAGIPPKNGEQTAPAPEAPVSHGRPPVRLIPRLPEAARRFGKLCPRRPGAVPKKKITKQTKKVPPAPRGADGSGEGARFPPSGGTRTFAPRAGERCQEVARTWGHKARPLGSSRGSSGCEPGAVGQGHPLPSSFFGFWGAREPRGHLGSLFSKPSATRRLRRPGGPGAPKPGRCQDFQGISGSGEQGAGRPHLGGCHGAGIRLQLRSPARRQHRARLRAALGGREARRAALAEIPHGHQHRFQQPPSKTSPVLPSKIPEPSCQARQSVPQQEQPYLSASGRKPRCWAHRPGLRLHRAPPKTLLAGTLRSVVFGLPPPPRAPARNKGSGRRSEGWGEGVRNPGRGTLFG